MKVIIRFGGVDIDRSTPIPGRGGECILRGAQLKIHTQELGRGSTFPANDVCKVLSDNSFPSIDFKADLTTRTRRRPTRLDVTREQACC